MGLRCFVAIELPDELRETIGELTRGLRASCGNVKWVPPKNLHLTLKFLGDTEESLIPEIREKLHEAASSHQPFSIAFRGAGAFPDLRRPRVVWAGAEDSHALVSLQRDVEKALSSLGFAPEGRPYSPHLTLGRVKSPGHTALLKREIEALKDTGFGLVEVAGISLMKSELKPSGAEHERLFMAVLGG